MFQPAKSTKNVVYLSRTDINSEGVYGCEVSTEGPSYQTVRGEKEMRIYGKLFKIELRS